MSENNVNGIAGADVATTTGIIGATIGIGQYIVNDYVITIAATEGDYGYTMTITRGTETQTVTLYGLTSEQYDAMLGYLEAAQTAAQNSASSANTAATARNAAQSARNAAQSARDDAQSASETSIQAANAAITARNSALTYANNAQTAANTANSARSGAEAARSAAVSAKTAAESAATRAETAAGQITGMTAEAETLAPGSSATASFLDGVLSLGIPAGATGATGADGNGIVSIIKTGTQGNVDTYTITMTDGSTSTFTVTNGTDGAVLSVAGKTGAVTLDAGDVEYDDTDTYAAGSVGAGIANLKSQLTTPFVWKDGYYSIATGAFAPQSGTVTYHSTEKFLGNEMPNIYNWDLVQSGDSFFMVWNNGTYAGYLMDGVWKKNTTVLDEPPAFTEWAIVLHNEPNYQDVRLIPFSTDAFGKIAVIIPRYSDNRKIAITDTEIVFPALTKIVYDYGYYAKSSTITVTRSAPAGGTVSDEVVVFDIASKTIKTYPTTNFNIASTERILFTLGIGDKSCSLAGSMYTYNGEPPFMPYDTARNTTIINLNDVSDLTEKIIETKYCGNNSKTGLSLIHFSDIHGSTTNIQRIIDLADYYSTYVDDIIHTGDSVATYYANNNPFATVGGDRVLNAIGNHDCWIEGDTWPHPYNATAAQTYDKFLSPYISSWGVTSAGTNLCYYYKDYSPYNIRLIVLDALHYDSAQETWLTSALAGAKTNGYSVIIAEHYPPQTGITAFDCTFTSYGISVDPVADPEEGAQIERLPESAYSVVDSYINGGGKFICWLAGHTHYDYIGKVTGHLNQIVVLINCGVVDARYGTDKRVNGTKTQDCLNVVGFDTTNHIIKICRVGISIDWFGRAKNYISIDYDNKQIIANS